MQAINLFFSNVPCRNITTMCRKIAFFVVHAEILLSRDKVSLESRAGPFLGVRAEIFIFGEIFTSALIMSKILSSISRTYTSLYPKFLWSSGQPRSRKRQCFRNQDVKTQNSLVETHRLIVIDVFFTGVRANFQDIRLEAFLHVCIGHHRVCEDNTLGSRVFILQSTMIMINSRCLTYNIMSEHVRLMIGILIGNYPAKFQHMIALLMLVAPQHFFPVQPFPCSCSSLLG